jgi:methionine-rich copper-binding protein CopC
MRNTILKFAVGVVCALAATSAFAHARLEKASPPVGGEVASPSELRLTFSEGVEPRFSGVTLAAEGGAAEPLGAPSVDPADNAVLVVKIAKPLAPGVYTVHWHAVSVDTHKTQGSFSFTVKP